MGLLGKALGLVQRIAPIIPGPGGLIAKGLGVLGKIGAKTPGVVKAGAGLAAGGAAFELGGRAVRGRPHRRVGAGDRYYNGAEYYRRRRHRTGLSGRDILGAQKVARVVSAFGYKPKFKKRKQPRR